MMIVIHGVGKVAIYIVEKHMLKVIDEIV